MTLFSSSKDITDYIRFSGKPKTEALKQRQSKSF